MAKVATDMNPFSYRDTCSCSLVGAAAREGDCELLCRYIQEGKPIDVRDNRGWTPLHEAAAHNSTKCLKVLLDCTQRDDPEEINLPSFEGETPLFLTAVSNCDESMKVLLDHGADVNIGNGMDQTPLMKLLCKNVVNSLCLELLIQYGANVNAQMWNGWSALHEAACRGHANIMKRLLHEGALLEAVDNYEIQPVFTAAQYGHTECLKILLEAGADPNSKATDDATALYIAAQENYPECVKLLLSHGALTELKIGDVTPLHVAAFKGNIKCMEILDPLTKAATRRYTPLHLAAQSGQLEAVKFLIKNGHNKETGIKFDPESETHPQESEAACNQSPLICALEEKMTAVTGYLLSLGLTESLTCSATQCPLNTAFPHIPCLKLLLKHGSDVNCGFLKIREVYLSSWKEYKHATKFMLDRGMQDNLKCNQCRNFINCEMETITDLKGLLKYIKLLSQYSWELKCCGHAISTLTKDASTWHRVREIIDKPLSLESLCRIYIRKTINPRDLITDDWVAKLPIPLPIKDILLYKDIRLDDENNPDTN